MYDKIDKMIADAMKNKAMNELCVYRAIKTAFMNYKVAKVGNVITPDVEITIINKLAAQRKEAIEQYTSANRMDLAEREQAELDILTSLMPKEPTEDEIIAEINSCVAMLDHKVGMADMKHIMGVVKAKYPTVNGGTVAKHVRAMM